MVPARKHVPSSLLCTKRASQTRILLLVRLRLNQPFIGSSRTSRRAVQLLWRRLQGPSPKVDSAAGSGHHQYRACSGMAAGRCECICMHSEAKTQDDLVSRRAAKKPLLSRKNIRDRLIFCKRSFSLMAFFPIVLGHLKTRWALPSVLCHANSILRPFMCGVAYQPREWAHSQFCLRTQPWIKNGTNTSSESNFSQPSRNSLVMNNTFSID